MLPWKLRDITLSALYEMDLGDFTQYTGSNRYLVFVVNIEICSVAPEHIHDLWISNLNGNHESVVSFL